MRRGKEEDVPKEGISQNKEDSEPFTYAEMNGPVCE